MSNIAPTSSILTPRNSAFLNPAPVEAFLRFLIRHGMRYIELASVTRRSIIDNERVFIKGAKGSHDRYIWDPELVTYILAHTSPGNANIAFSFSYKQLHKYLLKRNFFQKSPGKTNNRVTNLARSKRFKTLVAYQGELTYSISVAGGHRSKRSTRYYLDTPKPKK